MGKGSKVPTAATAAIIAMAVLGCEEQAPPPKATAQEPVARPLNVQLSLQVKGKDVATVSGKTNLPGRTKLQVLIEDESEELMEFREAVVQTGGNFSVEVVPKFGSWPEGKYAASVALFAEKQLPRIAARIGKRGKNLTGPIVRAGDSDGAAVFRVSKSVRLGSKQGTIARKKMLARRKKFVRGYAKRLKTMVRLGRKMISYRRSSTNRTKCYRLQEKHHRAAIGLGQDCLDEVSLGSKFAWERRGACSRVHTCVTCSPDHAQNACDEVDKLVSKLEKKL